MNAGQSNRKSGVVALAIALATTTGWFVFPCRDNKRPACEHGFKDASASEKEIEELWAQFPGPLIGIATGVRSDLDVLDIDSARHPEALAWWNENSDKLAAPIRTRSGGLHIYYRHLDGVKNSVSKLVTGIDVRGEGGYVIHWRNGVIEKPVDQFPLWLREKIWPPPSPKIARTKFHRIPNRGDPLVPLMRVIENAREGQRNSLLYWAACRAKEHIEAGRLKREEVEEHLAKSGDYVGLEKKEIAATIKSALGG